MIEWTEEWWKRQGYYYYESRNTESTKGYLAPDTTDRNYLICWQNVIPLEFMLMFEALWREGATVPEIMAAIQVWEQL